jgi:oligopeptide/dipeptide ABC transporter ATP-binding protein
VVVEEGSVEQIFTAPRHPYTQGLLESIPRLDSGRGGRLREIPGVVPSLYRAPVGCKFGPRCSHLADRCHEKEPTLFPISDGHTARCWLEDPADPIPRKIA